MFTRPHRSARLLSAVLGTILLGQHAAADNINWRSSLDQAKIEATHTGKLVMVHFYTSSCGPCKKLESDVFSQPEIAAAMERDYVPVKLNADQSPAIANAFQITRVPSEVVLTPQGNIVQKLTCPLEPVAYGAQLAKVAQQYQLRSANRTASAHTPIHSAYAGLRIGQSGQAAQPVATTPGVVATPSGPVVTQNPYFGSASPTVPGQQTNPSVPANAMPSSYRDRYAAITQQPPAVQQQAVAVAPAAQPAKPPVIEVPPAAAAPQMVQSAAPPKTASPVAEAPVTPPVASAVQAAIPAVVAEAWPPQLPPNTPELAFDGYCPVSLQQAQKWVRGDKTFGAIHRGRTYLFATDANRQKFLASPDAYSPVFSGNDPVKMLDENEKVAGSRKFGFEYRGAFYLFSSKETMARFASQPDRYSAGVRQAMTRMDSVAGGTIRR